MAANEQTLLKIQSLEQLYRTGYHSETVDATIDKLVGLERTRVEQEMARLEDRLHKFEDQYRLSSAEFHRQFRAGELGDEADFLELAEFFQVVHGQIETVEYRYQWMDPNQQALQKRWDNAKHYPELPNSPHHVHIGSTGRVEPGRPMNTVDLVELIEQELAA